MKNLSRFLQYSLLAIILLLAACGSSATQIQPEKTVTISSSFQNALTPVPTTPSYRCGAWSSNNAPDSFGTITIFAKLTKTVEAVSNAEARAVVHFQSMDVNLDQQPVSDSGGFVTFTLALAGRQPHKVPATVDVSFIVAGKALHCSPAFFTPL